MFRSLYKFAPDYALDLGSATTALYVQGVGVVAEEPSFVSVCRSGPRAGTIRAFGRESKDLWGKTSERLQTGSPVRRGIAADCALVRDLVRYFVEKIPRQQRLLPSRVIVGIPVEATMVEQRAISDVWDGGGLSANPYFVHSILAAALGAKLPLEEARGSMIVDVGASGVRAAIVSLGGIVCAKSIEVGGIHQDLRIREYLRRERSIVIGDYTAERLKIQVAAARRTRRSLQQPVQGQDLRTGLPTTVIVSQEELLAPLREPVEQVLRLVSDVLELAPPEMATDLERNGIILTGGGALLRNLDQVIASGVGLSVSIAERPGSAVVHGAGTILELWHRYCHLVKKQW